MQFTDIFVKRPVLSSALSIFIFLIGLFAIFKLPLRLFPRIESPMITIATSYPGANSTVVQSFVTSTIEDAIAGVDGIDFIVGSSSQGSSVVKVRMKLGYNSDTALTNVMEKVSAVRGQLPKGIDDPVIEKHSSDDYPIMILAFQSHNMSRAQVGDYVRRAIEPKLEAIDGISNADVLGGTYAMRLWLNPVAMAAHHVTPLEVRQAILAQNVQAAPGQTKGQYVTFNLSANTDLSTAKQFNNLVIKNSNGVLVRLKDIGKAVLGDRDDKINAVYNGQPATMVFIKTLPGANPLTIAQRVYEHLPGIRQSLPSDLKVNVVYDSAKYIHASIEEVLQSMLEAVAIVVLVVFLCLGALRSVLIPVITIPLSLVGVCFFLLLMKYSINTLTLLAMVLAIGLVVDDAIVVVENIFRHIEEGMHQFKAALLGAREISAAIIAMTITLAAVFAPIGFMGGLTGQLFAEFAFTLAGAVIISGFIALTLSPMMCSHILSVKLANNRFVAVADKVFGVVRNAYRATLIGLMRYKWWVIIFWIICLLGCVYFYMSTPKELAPKEDTGMLQVFATAPDYTNAPFLVKYMSGLNNIYASLPAIKDYIYVTGYPADHQAFSVAVLKDWSKRSLSTMQLQPMLQKKLAQIAGLQAVAILPSSLPGSGGGMPVQFVLKTTGSYRTLYNITEKMQSAAMKSGLFMYLENNLKFDQPELKVHIDRDTAATLGIRMEDIASSLSVLLGGNRLQQFSLSGRSYDVVPQVFQKYRFNPQTLNQINIETASGDVVPLSDVVSMSVGVQPAALNEFQKFHAVKIQGILMPGHTLSQALGFLKAQAEKIMPQDMSYDYAGASRQYIQEGNRMLVTFGIAFLVIFIVLAIQFESYRDPLIILLGSVPLALFAALVFLKMGFATINIYTQIGLLTLVGLVSKHGILMTKFANQLQESEGLSIKEAIIKASSLRFRAIVMTTAAMAFGILPLVLSHGAGAKSRFDIGIVITSGILLGSLFTLFVVPVLYLLIAKNRQAHRKKLEEKGFC